MISLARLKSEMCLWIGEIKTLASHLNTYEEKYMLQWGGGEGKNMTGTRHSSCTC